MACLSADDVWMVEVDLSGGMGVGRRLRRSAAERRRVVEETPEPGASVAKVALRYGVNANQVFQWRCLYRDGKLGPVPGNAMKLLPVSVVEVPARFRSAFLPGEIRISLRRQCRSGAGAYGAQESSRVISLPAGTRIWIAAGVTDMRRGFHGPSAQVRGKNNIWDPRTQTRGYTTNAALIAADIITDPVFGLGDSSVNQDQLNAAANICDEQVAVAALNGLTESRYTAHYVYDTSVTPGSALETIMQSMGGRLSRIGGEWYIFPAAWQGLTYSFNESHLTDTITWESYRSYSELVNQVTETYVAPNYPYAVVGDFYDDNGRDFAGRTQNNFSFGWMPTSFQYYMRDVLHGASSSIDQDADGGQVLPQDMTLSAVTSVTQAQRLAKIALMRNRQQGSGTFPMSLAGWQTQPCDAMQFSFGENCWTNKNLEVTGVTFTVSDTDQSGVQSVECQMSVQETDPSVYEWDPNMEELTVYCKRVEG